MDTYGWWMSLERIIFTPNRFSWVSGSRRKHNAQSRRQANQVENQKRGQSEKGSVCIIAQCQAGSGRRGTDVDFWIHELFIDRVIDRLLSKPLPIQVEDDTRTQAGPPRTVSEGNGGRIIGDESLNRLLFAVSLVVSFVD